MAQISAERKTAYYLGMILTIIGLLLFFSVFVTAATKFGDFRNFEADSKSMMFRGFGGFALALVGKILQSIGARGLAGSGLLLDPEKARQDLEPYSHMAGGMVKDALHAADSKPSQASQRTVVIKCASCGKLNEDDSKFCRECGKAI